MVYMITKNGYSWEGLDSLDEAKAEVENLRRNEPQHQWGIKDYTDEGAPADSHFWAEWKGVFC